VSQLFSKKVHLKLSNTRQNYKIFRNFAANIISLLKLLYQTDRHV